MRVCQPAPQAFDRIAARYDELWTNTDTGRTQRDAVWRCIDPLFRKGERIIDLGCGTGEDALHLSQAGIHVSAFDASSEMVRIARARGVDAKVLAIEEIEQIGGIYDGAISNFGALNCVPDLQNLLSPLARLIRPGGHLAICVMARFCLSETMHFLLRGQMIKASRRWSGESYSGSLCVPVFYPSVRRIERSFAPEFSLLRFAGIGAFRDKRLGRIAHLPFFRALSDHRLLVFVRN